MPPAPVMDAAQMHHTSLCGLKSSATCLDRRVATLSVRSTSCLRTNEDGMSYQRQTGDAWTAGKLRDGSNSNDEIVPTVPVAAEVQAISDKGHSC